MIRSRRRSLVAALAAIPFLLFGPAQAAPSTYQDPVYAQFDIGNVAKSLTGRPVGQLNAQKAQAIIEGALETWPRDLGEQVAALPYGRLYLGLGRLIPGASVGQPEFHDLDPVRVPFLTRTGAVLAGNLFWDGQAGPHPGIVITPGSIQGVQHGYWWAARTLARNGYLVLTFDAQGQGQSEEFGHEPGSIVPTDAGFPFQQAPNFIDGTIDALRFLLSTPSDPYLPLGWTADDRSATQAIGEDTIEWSNPLAAFADRSRVGLAGHSLGGTGAAVAQQCSDESDSWRRLPDLCGDRPYPIRAVVLWDGGGNAEPIVPTMMQNGDGYFLNPEPSPEAPDPRANLGSFERWQRGGVDAYSFSVRGGTHIEWWDMPLIAMATSDGVRAADFYTLAWFDRYVWPDQTRRMVASSALVDGPKPDGFTHGADELPWRADFFSVRYISAFDFHDADGARHVATDLRVYGGQSPVGDWAGALADDPAPRA